jgi:hypothetical protein
MKVGELEKRAITYLETGQQLHMWLPQGTYEIVRETKIKIREFQTITEYPALELLDTKGQTWYVAK